MDPDQMPQNAASDLGLHCFLRNSIQTLTVLSTSLGKMFFAWCFILNENILF